MVAASDPFGLVGTILARQYRVDRVVAEGGFGVVFEATHLALDTPVAIKVLRPPENVEPEQFEEHLDAFLEEAKTLARLDHAAIVRVRDAGVTEGPRGDLVGWMALEWISGKTLAEDLAQRRDRGGRSPREALTLLRPVLEAIGAAHARGIVHRDLKPSNIMVVEGPRGPTTRVLDFGIAKVMDGESRAVSTGVTETRSQHIAFTRGAAAPEQISGTRTGPWTDVFALGLVLTEVLSDKSPLAEHPPDEQMRRLFDAERPTPASLGVDVGVLEPLLARALAVKPEGRFADARALLAAIESALATTGSPTALTTPPPPPRPSARRWRWYAAPAALVVVGLAGYGVRRTMNRENKPAVAYVDASGSTTKNGGVAKCVSHRACTANNGGVASICRPATGKCVPLASVDCTVLADPRTLASDDAIFVGSMFPTSGPDAIEFGTAHQRAVDLGRIDFDRIMEGVALQSSTDAAHPLGVIACDDAVDPKRAAAHLVDEVGVPAIIGFRNGLEHIELASTSFVPNGVLSLDATSTNPLVTHLPQPVGGPRLVFRTTYDSTSSAAAISAFVAEIVEPTLTTPTRVSLVRNKSAIGTSFAEAVTRTLRLGGKSAATVGAAFQDLSCDEDRDASAGR